MEELKLDIIRKVMMLETTKSLKSISENVSDAISRECEQDDHDQEEFKKWKEKKR